MALGQGANQAGQLAVGHAYQEMLREASMLSYMNAFWLLSVIIACLIPLPFIIEKAAAAGEGSGGGWGALRLRRRGAARYLDGDRLAGGARLGLALRMADALAGGILASQNREPISGFICCSIPRR